MPAAPRRSRRAGSPARRSRADASSSIWNGSPRTTPDTPFGNRRRHAGASGDDGRGAGCHRLEHRHPPHVETGGEREDVGRLVVPRGVGPAAGEVDLDAGLSRPRRERAGGTAAEDDQARRMLHARRGVDQPVEALALEVVAAEEDQEPVRQPELPSSRLAVADTELVEIDARRDQGHPRRVDAVVALEIGADDLALRVDPDPLVEHGTALHREQEPLLGVAQRRGGEARSSGVRVVTRSKDARDVHDVADPGARQAGVDGVERLPLEQRSGIASEGPQLAEREAPRSHLCHRDVVEDAVRRRGVVAGLRDRVHVHVVAAAAKALRELDVEPRQAPREVEMAVDEGDARPPSVPDSSRGWAAPSLPSRPCWAFGVARAGSTF